MHAFETMVGAPMEEVEPMVRAALADEGFGVLTEIDVAATFQAKLGVRRAPLKILGACNPGFAHRAIQIDPSTSLALPCNVVLEGVDGGTRVAIADPRDMMTGPDLSGLVDEVTVKLESVVVALGETGS
jgi:uncharacterized protein (DUF302 family)